MRKKSDDWDLIARLYSTFSGSTYQLFSNSNDPNTIAVQGALYDPKETRLDRRRPIKIDETRFRLPILVSGQPGSMYATLAKENAKVIARLRSDYRFKVEASGFIGGLVAKWIREYY